MRASSTCLRMIADFERFRPTAYKPTPKDVWTLGYGHTNGVLEGSTCTMAQALAWLHDDIRWAEADVNHSVKVKLTQNQFDALVSLVFNIGGVNFIVSTLLRMLDRADYEGAAAEFDRWNKQKGAVLAGLTTRRAAERRLFEKVGPP